jgi:hypothetical protein
MQLAVTPYCSASRRASRLTHAVSLSRLGSRPPQHPLNAAQANSKSLGQFMFRRPSVEGRHQLVDSSLAETCLYVSEVGSPSGRLHAAPLWAVVRTYLLKPPHRPPKIIQKIVALRVGPYNVHRGSSPAGSTAVRVPPGPPRFESRRVHRGSSPGRISYFRLPSNCFRFSHAGVSELSTTVNRPPGVHPASA